MNNFICTTCNLTVPTNAKLNKHVWEKHGDINCILLDDSPCQLKRENGAFTCLCERLPKFTTRSGLLKHVSSGKCTVLKSISESKGDDEGSVASETNPVTNYDEDDADYSDEDINGAEISRASQPKPSSQMSVEWKSIEPTSREYNHSILYACDALDWGMEEQHRLLTILDTYHLQPIALKNDGNEETALIHLKHLNTINQNHYQASSIIRPLKRKRQDTMAIGTMMNSSLYSSIVSGPYCQKFMTYNYIEMTDQLSAFLNQDWLHCPRMRYACNRLFSGCILIDSQSGKSIVVNAVEIYGRTRSVDSHRESFRDQRGAAGRKSLPPDTTRYCNIWATTLIDADGKKLIIGSKTFNILITSSLRLDVFCEPEVGPTTAKFTLENHQKSINARIYIKESAWKAAMEIADNKVEMTPSFDILCRLRQLRTRFHQSSTYLQCRSFNETTDDIMTRPYTIFTLHDWDSGSEDSGYRLASKLFKTVAESIICGNGKLDKGTVVNLKDKSKSNNEIGKTLQEITNLFGDFTLIDIIGNKQLNIGLEKLAKHLASPISKANISVKAPILESFTN